MLYDSICDRITTLHISTDLFRWDQLCFQYESISCPTLTFKSFIDEWDIQERFDDAPIHLHYTRNKVSLQRKTIVDEYSCIGLSQVTQKESVILTEGISDYFTAFLMFRDFPVDVIGLTKLGGNKYTKSFILSVYSSIYIIADNDATGISNASRMMSLYKSYGKHCKIIIPQAKDLTEQVYG